jgi:hypothetical protein
LKEEFQDRTILFDVIDPVVDYLGTRNFTKIGVIGTKRTISKALGDAQGWSLSVETKVSPPRMREKVLKLAAFNLKVEPSELTIEDSVVKVPGAAAKLRDKRLDEVRD